MIANFVLAGQSNIDEWFKTADGAALETFKQTFLALNPDYSDVQFFDAARGGSAMLSGSAEQYADSRAGNDTELHERISENFWYDEASGSAGPNLTLFTHRIEAEVASGTEFLGVIWAQGEADTTYVGTNGAEAYSDGLTFVLDRLMEASGAAETYIQALGDRAFYSEELHGGTEAIRQAQQDVANSSDAITIATTVFDLELRDSVHLTDEGYHIAAERLAIAISTGETSPGVGETILLNSTTLLVQFDLAPDQTFSGNFDLGGFVLEDSGAEVEIVSASMTERGLLRVEAALPLTSPTLSYGSPDVAVAMQAADYIYVEGPNGLTPVQPFLLTLAPPRAEVTENGTGLTLEGDRLSETITGLSGDDILIGNAGHDTLDGGWGEDVYLGGDGSDVFVLSNDGARDVVLDFDVKRDAIGLEDRTKEDVSFHSEEDGLEVRTSDGQQILLIGVDVSDTGVLRFHTRGTEAANTLEGHDGNDRIFAYEGDDTIDAGAGTDRITTGDGEDTVVFGSGYDLNIVYDFDLDSDTIALTDLQAGDLTFSAYKTTDLELRTESGDRLVLRNVDLADADQLKIIDAPPTSGVLTGTADRDILQGTELGELFIGFGGTDRLYGGGGNNVFEFHEGYGLNIVYDFNIGQDQILIDEAEFENLSFLTYKETDAELRLSSGDRLVLRDVDIDLLTVDDFIFSTPEIFV